MRSSLFCWSRRLLTSYIFTTKERILFWDLTNSKRNNSTSDWWSQLDYNSFLEEKKIKERKSKLEEQHEHKRIPVVLSSLINAMPPSSPTQETMELNLIENEIVKSQIHENLHPIETNVIDEGQTGLGFSGVPCGGCGAELHCQNKDYPGFMLAERFQRMNKKQLMTEICQRCYLLAEHNTSLKITVPNEDYPSVLSQIQNEFAMVLLLVDLLDFPCSVWPELVHLIGTNRPVFLVGNKVDLLPQDSSKYLTHVTNVLQSTVRETSLKDANIVHTCLISAETGYGVEDLISNILRLWGNKGHVYIMGCRNVGKSSLFNVFLNSDLCEVQVGELIQRATVSQWPGTTLNLLKFPVLRTYPWRLAKRNQRLLKENKSIAALRSLRKFELHQTKDKTHSVPIGYVGQSFMDNVYKNTTEWTERTLDLFHVNPTSMQPPNIRRPGTFNSKSKEFIDSPWCFDTPGVVGVNQLLDDLNMEEINICVPKTMILPRTYILRPGKTLFIGGLYRFDYIEGTRFIRLTVFTSSLIPITILATENANHIYTQGLGTEVFGVPFGDETRLRSFPALESNSFLVDGIGYGTSCADIVISSLGWTSVSGAHGQGVQLNVYSPRGKGVYCRQPSLLPLSVRLRGEKLRDLPTYTKHETFIPLVNNS